MAEAIVEQFETVQVDMQQRQATPSTLAHPLMSFVQALAEQERFASPVSSS